ncbi:MAG: serine/threonine protein kinase [Acidobacteriota bacterium]|nr:serine/threonine protein kinase [Acidobacteriota bacterium]
MSSSDHSDLFLALTPERVLAAVAAGGLEVTGLCYSLNSFENRVYEIELVDGTRVVAKFYRPHRWTAEQILEEHSVLADLAAAEIPVCDVRPFPDGETLKTIEGIYYCLSDRQGGRAPDELDGALARRLGMLIGRLHTVLTDGTTSRRPNLDADRYVRDALQWIEQWRDRNGALSEPIRRRFFAAAETIATLADDAMTDVATHRLHADVHLGNILLRDGDLRLLDFDDMAVGPPVQDIWLAIPGRDEDSLRLRALLLEGYEQFRLFDYSTLQLIEPLRGLRMVRYIGWLARRWHDPAFKAAWPHFGTEEYWRRETDDLEDQLAAIRTKFETPDSGPLRPAEHGVATDGDIELTNEDYFWDWEDE